MNPRKIIGINLKYYRYKSGLSQEDFYNSLGLSPKYLACVERGEINTSIDFLYKLSKTLKVDIVDLLTYDESRIINTKRIDSKELV